MTPWWMQRHQWVAFRITLAVGAQAVRDGCDAQEAYCRGVDAGNAYLRRVALEPDEPRRPRLRGWWWSARQRFLLGYRQGLEASSARERLREQRKKWGV